MMLAPKCSTIDMEEAESFVNERKAEVDIATHRPKLQMGCLKPPEEHEDRAYP